MQEKRHQNIMGAVARVWCHPDNSNKTMDSDLAMAIVSEIEDMLEKEELLLRDIFGDG